MIGDDTFHRRRFVFLYYSDSEDFQRGVDVKLSFRLDGLGLIRRLSVVSFFELLLFLLVHKETIYALAV